MKLKPKHVQSTAINLLYTAARQDLSWFHQLTHPCVSGEPYISAYHLRALAYAIQRILDGEYRRVLIAIPPRHFKSSVASVALPALLLGQNPSLKIICASYGLDLAKEFAQQSLQIMQSPIYKALFPKTALYSKKPALEALKTTHNGYRLATSVDGPLTGKGADFIIVDDPMKAQDAFSAVERERVWQWFTTSLMTRFDKPKEGKVVVVMQRLHQDDLIGRLKEDPSWEVIEFPAATIEDYMMYLSAEQGHIMKAGELLFPQRFSKEALKQLRAELGEDAYNAQMLQRPVPAGGGIFKLAKAKRFDVPPRELWHKHFDRRIISIDPAGSTSLKADYSAVTWWGFKGPHIYLLDAVRGQWGLPELLSRVRTWRHSVHGVLVEAAGVGLSLHSMLYDDNIQGVWKWTPKNPKEVRATQANIFIDQGIIQLPKKAPWLDAFQAELSVFPQGKNDDFVDSFSQVAWNINKLRTAMNLPLYSWGDAA